MRHTVFRLGAGALALAIGAAGAEAQTAESALRLGEDAFRRQCASCHASRDGLDLAFFGYPDSTIVRRALEHVDEVTAGHIAAWVRSLGESRADRQTRLFQPGGAVLAGDVAFAEALFGADRWPADLTTAELRAKDPRHVPVAIPLPMWSDESNRTDWMPEVPLPEAILDADGGRVRLQLERYYRSGSADDLGRAVAAVQNADRRSAGRPICRIENAVPDPDFEGCFELRRWTASLVAQHMLRTGMDEPLSPALHNTWWLVGDVFRRSRGRAVLGDDHLNRAAWFYLSFMFAPGRQTTAYTLPAFAALGLPRHATWVALRSAVEQPAGRVQTYGDVALAARHAPAHWTGDVVTFGFRHLLERIQGGDRPVDPVAAERQIDQALTQARRRLGRAGPDVYASLATLGDEVRAALRAGGAQ